MSDLDLIFGSNVFSDAVMQQRLPKETYRSLRKTMDEGRSIDPQIAGVVANAMKDWALERGATHYTHWFQPMTGITAEKHESFLNDGGGGRAILEFSGKELVRGEPDASSFPSGGLRSTFEARGYTAWDPTSYAFIKDQVLYIPTAFCSYGGEALDKKTPLLRSMEAINRQALRILKLFNRRDATRVIPTVGAEQEYFLVDEALYAKRRDLIFTGRTLFGSRPPKGQEMEDHYFGAITPRVKCFMNELNEDLWRLGIVAKTEHNETAPSQHELAPMFNISNIAADQNQLVMERMKIIARRHGLICLLAEKPYAWVNGSGKHNNWSMVTNTGYNLLEPGDSPHESAQFLLFLTAMIKAVDDYQGLLRSSVASAGNDHRLGGFEAPPAIISIFLGDELTAILDAIERKEAYHGPQKSDMTIGVHVLPRFPKDTTDRNRTSPFAFTGNKFEFRSVGSSMSISEPNTVLNTIMAESLRQFADELECAPDLRTALQQLIIRTIREHRRIIYNGNNYTAQWVEEAERRGLLNLPSTVEALQAMVEEKNIQVFVQHRIYSETEIRARYEISLENYVKTINIEAETALLMVRQEILPVILRYMGDMAGAQASLQQACSHCTHPDAPAWQDPYVTQLQQLRIQLHEKTEALTSALADGKQLQQDMLSSAIQRREHVLPALNSLREVVDSLEAIVEKNAWPLPSYGELLFSES